MVRNGRLGMIDRFTLYSSNLLPTAVEGAATAFRVFAGHPHGLTFASQITKLEQMRSERSFSTLLAWLAGVRVQGPGRHRHHRAVRHPRLIRPS